MPTLGDYILYAAAISAVWMLTTQTKKRYRKMNAILFVLALLMYGLKYAIIFGTILAILTAKPTEEEEDVGE